MWNKLDRRNVDIVEGDFCSFKTIYPETFEDLIEVVEADFSPFEPLSTQLLTSEFRQKFLNYSPWGYSFQIDLMTSAFQFDQEKNNNLVGLHDHGLDEMRLRLSVLDRIMKDSVRAGDRWLDVATNCGYIPVQMEGRYDVEVEAFDLFKKNIEKADLLSRVSGCNSVIKFSVGDAYEVLEQKLPDSFEFVTALGLFYHLNNPLGLLEKLYRITSSILVIDTVIHHFPFSGWIQTISRHTKYSYLSHANDTRRIYELHPTYRGLIDSLFQIGFNRVREFRPSKTLLEVCPSDVYRSRNRLFLVAEK